MRRRINCNIIQRTSSLSNRVSFLSPVTPAPSTHACFFRRPLRLCRRQCRRLPRSRQGRDGVELLWFVGAPADHRYAAASYRLVDLLDLNPARTMPSEPVLKPGVRGRHDVSLTARWVPMSSPRPACANPNPQLSLHHA